MKVRENALNPINLTVSKSDNDLSKSLLKTSPQGKGEKTYPGKIQKSQPKGGLEATEYLNGQEIRPEALLEDLNRFLKALNLILKVEIDQDLKIPIFKIVDFERDEVVKQIPLEEILKFKKALTAFLEKYGKNLIKEQEPEGVALIKGFLLNREV